MELNFALICEHAYADKDERLSIIQTFDTIKSDKFPATHPKLTVVASYSIEKEDFHKEHSHLVSIFNPGGKKLLEVDIRAPVGEKTRANFISYFNNLPLEQEGDYKIKIDLDGENKKELTLKVIKA